MAFESVTERERPVVRRRPRRAPWKSREQLLRAATREFVAHGFAGARISRIVKNVAVLEEALGGLRKQELQIDVEGLDPQKGLLQLFDFIASHFENNGDLVRLLTAENLLKARYMRKSSRIPEMSSPVLTMIEQLIERGTRTGQLAKGLDGLRLYILMVALSQFHLSNVHTLSTIFGRDLSDASWRRERMNDARRMVERFLNG
jgi:AcrR family transcriptional regulator